MATTAPMTEPFDDALSRLRGLVAEMGGLAEQAIGKALTALASRDAAGAARVVEADRRIDAIEAEIEDQVVSLIARHAPAGDDLRDLLAALKIVGVIERMGDYAKNIARRVPILVDVQGIEALSVLPAMGRLTAEMVRDALDAYAARDADRAQAVCRQDRAVDDFYNSLFRTLLTYMMEQPHNISPSTHLLFIAKNLERIGDHATNVAEMVYFAATGRHMAERQRGADIYPAPASEGPR